MPTPVTIPNASISMEEGTIIRWHVTEGDPVSITSVLFDLETDKAVLDVPAPTDGVLLRILTGAGPVRVEQVVGWMGATGESIPMGVAAGPTEPGADCPVRPSAQPSQSRAGAQSTPAARRRAAELAVDIATLAGSGPNGGITQEDVERAAATKTSTPKVPAHSRSELARSLSHTWQTVPHIHVSRRLEVDVLAEAREKVRSRQITVTDTPLFALARVLPSFPGLTSIWKGERLLPASAIHIAFAVDTARGVVAPVKELLAMGATPSILEVEDKAARQTAEAAVEFAKNSPMPGLDTLYEGTYAGF